MDALRRALADIQKNIGSLGTSAKVAIGLLVALLVSVLLLAAAWSGRTTMVEAFPAAPADFQKQAMARLSAANIRYEPRDGRVYVRPEDRYTALAFVYEDGKAPGDPGLMFRNLVGAQHWMKTKSQNDQQYNLALMNELGAVIKEFRGVRDARVVIGSADGAGLGANFTRPTASVTVWSDSGQGVGRGMVDAVAALVSGAKPGLLATDVKVIDGSTGRQFTPRSGEEMSAGDWLEYAARVEERVQEKLNRALGSPAGVVVTVSAQVDLAKKVTSETRALKLGDGSLSAPVKEMETETTSSESSGAAAPGVVSNTAMDIESGGAGGGTSSKSTTAETEFKLVPGTRRQEVVDPRGMPTKVTAMIGLSRGYVAELVRQGRRAAGAAGGAAPAGGAGGGGGGGGAGDPEPTQAEIDAEFAKEKQRLEADLDPLVRTVAVDETKTQNQGEKVVVVSMIPLLAGVGMGDVGGAGAQGAGLLGTGGGMGGLGAMMGSGVVKQVLLGVLAVAALGMMGLAVRKAGNAQKLPSAEQIVGLPPALEPSSDLVGEADESQTAMLGIELAEDELKTKKMLEQVTDLVKKSPADAAALVNRWVAVET